MADTDQRTYHNTSTPYSLPNDASEHQRLNLQSGAIVEMMHNEPIQAPLARPNRILEVGCGTGITTRYFAQKFPEASQIIGIDLSPVPQDEKVPGNVAFIEGDFRAVASSPKYPQVSQGQFDYIFSRMLVYGMTDWPGYIAKAKELLAPGGWIELQELAMRVFNDDKNLLSSDWNWLNEQWTVWADRGLDMGCGAMFEGYLRDAGFVDIRVKKYRWQFTRWEGHPETDTIAAYTTKYLPDAKWGAYKKVIGPRKTTEELERIEKQLRKDMGPSENGKHYEFWVVCGRKP